MDGFSIGRVTDVELIPHINHFGVGDLHAADPEFFSKVESWMRNDVLFHVDALNHFKERAC